MKAIYPSRPSESPTNGPRVLMDAGLFAVNLLQTEDELHAAISSVERWVDSNDAALFRAFDGLLSIANVLPFILSHVDERVFAQITRRIIQSFPQDNDQDLQRLLSFKFLMYFSDFWDDHRLPFDDARTGAAQCSRSVRDGMAVLDVLQSLRKTNATPFHGISSGPFHALGLKVPRNNHDAQKTAAKVLRDLQGVLKYHFKLTREGRLRDILKHAYLGCGLTIETSGSEATSTAIYDILSSKKSGFILGNTQGFGKTPILISSRLVRNLRQAKVHSKLFRIIVKTLRALSEGDCLGSDSVLARNESTGAMIYSSSISRHCILVYHYKFDEEEVCQEPASTKSQCDDAVHGQSHSTAIRVFGVYATANLDYKFWNEVAAQLDARGHHSPAVISLDRTSSTAYQDQIRDMIVLNQFVHMSQNIVNDVLQNREVVQHFEMSKQEEDVANYSGSCYVYGRSGTGKTTVILSKMLRLEFSWLENQEMLDYQKPRQVQLTDDDFPLFISYDNLCSLLEMEIIECFKQPLCSMDRHDHTKQGASLTYEIFLSQIWSAFSEHFTKDLDPREVFAEFIGVIEGSERTLDFETSAIIWQLKELREHHDPNLCRDIDFIYVDETQDLLLIDVQRTYWLRNPNGLLWAGDSAQTIAAGSSFTFNELKAFVYRIEENEVKMGRLVPPAKPAVFKLNINFRSYWGIVNCGQTVLDLLGAFWPTLIDQIPAESGRRAGSLPLCLTSEETESAIERVIWSNEGYVEFGATQCILVRDDETRRRLKPMVGDMVLIMTIFESKGLEFNDVRHIILYDFFKSSPFQASQWRSVANSLVHDKPSLHVDPPANGLRKELQSLYVAITRARHTLWIIDASDRAIPMQRLWADRNQISVVDQMDMSHFATSSSKEDWAKAALEFFEKKLFIHAQQAYTIADQPHKASVAAAYGLRESAEVLPLGVGKKAHLRSAAFRKAADAFLQLAPSEEADKARKSRLYYHHAAECLEHVPDKVQAAMAYSCAGNHTKAALLYKETANFDEAVDEVSSHEGDILPATTKSVRYTAGLWYFTGRPNKEHIDNGIKLFGSEGAVLQFLEAHGLSALRLSLLHNYYKRYVKAIKGYSAVGNFQQAFKIYTHSDLSRDDLSTINHLVQNSCQNELHMNVRTISSRTTSRKVSDRSLTLLKFLDSLASFKACLSREAALEIDAFSNLMNPENKTSHLYKLADGSMPKVVSILYLEDSLDFSRPTVPHLPTIDGDTLLWLRVFVLYTMQLRALTLGPDLLEDPTVLRLFGCERVSHYTYKLANGGPSFRFAEATKLSSVLHAGEDMLVTKPVLRRSSILDICLRQAFSDRITDANKSILQNLSPSRNTLLCGDQQIESLRDRLQLAFLGIPIMDSLHSLKLLSSGEFVERGREWLLKLFDLLTEEIYNLGLDVFDDQMKGLIPESKTAIAIANIWIRAALRDLDQDPHDLQLTYKVKLTILRHILSGARRTCFRLPIWVRAASYHDGLPLEYKIKIGEDLYPSDRYGLQALILFIVNTVDRRATIEVGIVVLLTEFACAWFSFSSQLHDTNSVDGVIFPSKCLQLIFQNRRWDQELDVSAICLLFRTIVLLLEEVLKPQKGFLTHKGRALRCDGEEFERRTFISRLCEAMGSVGINVANDVIRGSIVNAASTMQGALALQPTEIENRFIMARSWEEYAKALEGSRLLKAVATGSSGYVVEQWTPSTDGLNTDTLPEERAEAKLTADTPNAAPAPATSQPAVQTQPEFTVEALERSILHGLRDAISHGMLSSIVFTKRRLVLLRKVQRRLLRRFRNKRFIDSPLACLRTPHFEQVKKAAEGVNWTHKRTARLVFMAPSHPCSPRLDSMRSEFQILKEIDAKKLPTTGHEEIEALGHKVKGIHDLIQEVVGLQNALTPESLLRNLSTLLDEMRTHANAIDILIKKLPEHVAKGIREEFELGRTGISRASRLRWK
ncbi:hypothetical protein NM688_g4205 [Phlebia brevispora]|uniref:Uncharacterized protein n=1 Tax=Phlebia brevispora TaxID=194682 RepID=A0ACC1T3Q3_9APHY|nr:hypothetical protein NM688_g4205 [Phlebia brevispora]